MKILWGAKFFGAPFCGCFFEVLCGVFLKCFAAGVVGCQESLRFF